MKFFVATPWWLLLVLCSLGSCQRAIYQGQATANATQQVVVPAPMPESASITIAAQPLAQANEGYVKAPQHKSGLVRPRQMRRSVRLPFVRASATAHALSRRITSPPQEDPITKPIRYRSRGIALLLAILSLLYLPLSLHNFYLGYYGRGALAIAAVILGTYLVVFAFLGSLFSGTAIVGLGLLGLAILGGWFVWQIVDLVRIITQDLKPKNGEYYPQFFQTSPNSNSTPRTN